MNTKAQNSAGGEISNTAFFYRKPVGLDKVRHRDYKFAPIPHNGFGFARKTRVVVLTAVEFNDALREYPIVFIKAGDDSFSAMTALSLDGKTNVFIKDDGSWNAGYIPAFVRRYPFIPGVVERDKSLEESGRFAILVDEEYENFSPAADGIRLFTDDGEATKELDNISTYLKNFHSEHIKTTGFINKLKELDLLVAKTMNVGPRGGKDEENIKIGGIWVVDEERLKKLDKDKVYELFKSGELFLIYAHLASLRNFAQLMTKRG